MNVASGRGGRGDSHRELSIDSARCWVAGGKKSEARGGEKLLPRRESSRDAARSLRRRGERQTGEEQREAEVEATREKLIERKRDITLSYSFRLYTDVRSCGKD